jgi:hypothetical protein
VTIQRPGRQTNVPDLLRRFTRTPLRFNFRIRETQVLLETNDSRLVAVTASFGSEETLHSGLGGHAYKRQFHWKLVREDELSHDTNFSIVVTDDLFVVFRGDKTVISVDRSLGEVLGFVAADVSDEEMRTQMFPLLARCCDGASSDQQFHV